MHKDSHQLHPKKKRPLVIGGVVIPAIPYERYWFGGMGYYSGAGYPNGDPDHQGETAQHEAQEGSGNDAGTGTGEAAAGGDASGAATGAGAM